MKFSIFTVEKKSLYTYMYIACGNVFVMFVAMTFARKPHVFICLNVYEQQYLLFMLNHLMFVGPVLI